MSPLKNPKKQTMKASLITRKGRVQNSSLAVKWVFELKKLRAAESFKKRMKRIRKLRSGRMGKRQVRVLPLKRPSSEAIKEFIRAKKATLQRHQPILSSGNQQEDSNRVVTVNACSSVPNSDVLGADDNGVNAVPVESVKKQDFNTKLPQLQEDRSVNDMDIVKVEGESNAQTSAEDPSQIHPASKDNVFLEESTANTSSLERSFSLMLGNQTSPKNNSGKQESYRSQEVINREKLKNLLFQVTQTKETVVLGNSEKNRFQRKRTEKPESSQSVIQDFINKEKLKNLLTEASQASKSAVANCNNDYSIEVVGSRQITQNKPRKRKGPLTCDAKTKTLVRRSSKAKHGILDKQKLKTLLKRVLQQQKQTPIVTGSTETSINQNQCKVPEKSAPFHCHNSNNDNTDDSSKSSLKERMIERLNSARFRYINEQLYTTTGEAAVKLFAEDADAFAIYHKGYQTQMKKWPMNPLNIIINDLKKKPLNFVIADFGCGDAKLAKSLLNVVHSFDLVAMNEHVVACDMAKVPLENRTVDVVVFCLSLMGTNLTDYLMEANRILKIGGLLKIAEVESRFENVDHFIEYLKNLGFTLLNKNLNHKMFILFDLKKSRNCTRKSKNLAFTLQPCVYKKR